ncbi:MAG: alpha/beta hydrolase [Planctomycetota bacterium]|nr:alpha/beta hydrolase [Planctomycetota bacterium]MDA1249670.1 alpha/beta hydrolase [Planctomycetota bacterium]
MLRIALTIAVIGHFSNVSLADDDPSKPETLSLWNGKAPVGLSTFSDEDPTITVYRAANPNGTAIVICPGGGYGGLAIEPEGHGIARWLNKHGITGVVLKYRMPKGRSNVPLSDALRAIQMTRLHGKDWNIDASRVGVMGFSAGGHLASTCATQFSAGDPKAKDPHDRISARPDFAILIYPVITMGEHTHGGSKRNLLGEKPLPGEAEAFSSELRVTSETPPTFLAHAVDDKPVPPINSELFYEALKAKKVPARYLKLPNGGHGLNGYKGSSWDAWQTQSLEWFENLKLGRNWTTDRR